MYQIQVQNVKVLVITHASKTLTAVPENVVKNRNGSMAFAHDINDCEFKLNKLITLTFNQHFNNTYFTYYCEQFVYRKLTQIILY